jgi:hypothetical protein
MNNLDPERQERQLLERETTGTDTLNAGCVFLALAFWLIAVPLVLIFS